VCGKDGENLALRTDGNGTIQSVFWKRAAASFFFFFFFFVSPPGSKVLEVAAGMKRRLFRNANRLCANTRVFVE